MLAPLRRLILGLLERVGELLEVDLADLDPEERL